jgi:hypothetical protein
MLRILLSGILACTSLGAIAQAPPANKPGHYLFVWTADHVKQGNDFLAVIDADPASPSYGELVASADTDIKSVRIHDTEYEMPAGGMLFANDHDANQSVIFDLRDPLKPKVAVRFQQHVSQQQSRRALARSPGIACVSALQ